MAQTSISSFMRPSAPAKRKGTETECGAIEKRQKLSSEDLETKSKPKIVRKFKAEWKVEFPWVNSVTKDNATLMICEWCKDARKSNPFATGTQNLQKSALSRHERHIDHLLAAEARRASSKGETVAVSVEQQINRCVIQNEDSKIAQFRTLYFVAKNGLPLNMQNNLIELQKQNGCPSLQEKSTLYTGAGTQDEMLDYIDMDIREGINANLEFSDFVGIIIDETTDITIHKKLNIYFKCFKAGTVEPVIHFTDCVAIHNGKAETIVSEIEKVCGNLGLDMRKIISMSSDGASVMTGRKNGVGVKLRESHNHRLVQVHCVAHRLALCAGQACKDVDSFKDYHSTVKNVYRFFHNSAIRYNELRAMETVLDDSLDTKHVSLKEPASFRWLSLESAVKAIGTVYPALLSTLENQSAEGNSEAKGLLQKVRQSSFILKTAFLTDVFAIVNKLCRVFQKDELDIEMVNIMVDSTIQTLDHLKSSNGEHLQAAYDALKDNKYKGVKVVDTQNSRMGFQNAATGYLQELKENIESRFEEKSMDKLQMSNKILNPAYLPTTSAALTDYGKDELDLVCDWLGPKGDVSGLVDCDRMKADHFQFKVVLKNFRGKSLKCTCQDLIKQYSDLFPDYCVLAKYMLTAPLTSVACERGFSSQNRLKTKSRSTLDHIKVAKLIRITEEGPSTDQFDAERVVRKFVSSKSRRK